MARADLCEQAYKQVKNSVELGAKVLLGGKPTDSFNFPATILVNITENMPAFKEEVFGPVISIIKAKSEPEAIRLANNTEYGLGATIISKNVNRVKNEIVPHIQSGMVFVNDNPKSFVQVPFGGHKCSGIGRELGENGIKEFCNVKTVYIA
jgi:succinate-semialdehyde dehydrogenase/glutarate-semialdehyde dehydrogenase